MKLLTTTALFTAMAVAPALAQTPESAPAQDRAQPQVQTQQTQPRQPAELNFMQQQQYGQWSAEWLTNSNVYSPQDENIGTINDIILSSDGSIEAVVIGVGGFLGIGEKNVAVKFDALEMRPAPTGGWGMGTQRDPAQLRPGATAPAAGAQQQRPVGQPQATTQQQPGTAQELAERAEQRAERAEQMAERAQQEAQRAQQQQTGQQQTATGQQRVTGMGADDVRIYINASREQLEAAPEYNRLPSQEGVLFGTGSAQ